MFDNICKFIAENFSDDLATWLLGSPLSLTVLDPTELQLDPIRADSLIFLQSEQLILHTEFQTDPDSKIARTLSLDSPPKPNQPAALLRIDFFFLTTFIGCEVC